MALPETFTLRAMLKLAEPPAPARTTPMAPRERIAGARAVLCDLDGCLAESNVALPGAAAFARSLGERLYIVSNNSTHDPLGLSQELALHGLEVPPHRIVLAGLLAVETIARRRPGARILIAGSPVLRARARMLGLQLVSREADVVLLARDTGFDYARLESIVRELSAGAELFASNSDVSHPGRNGRLIPETGCLLAAVRACLPETACTVIGKPKPALYEEALRRAGCSASEAIMVGDNPATDISGALLLGMDALLVGRHPLAEAAGPEELIA